MFTCNPGVTKTVTTLEVMQPPFPGSPVTVNVVLVSGEALNTLPVKEPGIHTKLWGPEAEKETCCPAHTEAVEGVTVKGTGAPVLTVMVV